MPAVIRCILCGKDNTYARYAEGGRCEECERPLKPDNVRVIITRDVATPADPLDGM